MTVPTEASDAAVLNLIARLVREEGEAPSRNALMREAGIGAGRASRLLHQYRSDLQDRYRSGLQERTAEPGPAGPDTVTFAAVRDDPAPTSVALPRVTERQAGETNGNGHRGNGHRPIVGELGEWPPPEAPADWADEHAQAVTLDRTEDADPEPVRSEEAAPVREPEPVRSSEGDESGPVRAEQVAAPGPDRVEAAEATERTGTRTSTWLFILGAVVGLVVSVDTSWRFFEEKVGITNVWERVAMFAGVEILLIACGVAMYEGVRSARKSPGPARWLAWALCAVSAYAALTLAGWPVGPARVILGPVLSVVAFHHALGIELRARHGKRTGAWARVARELRERVLSRLGLADDGRDAAERTRRRAARRAAKLARASAVTPFRRARLRRALRLADVAHQPRMREVMLAELQTLQHADKLANLQQASPWERAADPV